MSRAQERPEGTVSVDGQKKVAIVTGAARGLGKSIALALLEAGYRIVASDVARSLPESLRAPAGTGPLVHAVTDLADPGTGHELVELALATFGRCDAVVNNAGVGGPGVELSATTDAQLAAVLEINLLGAARLCREAIPHLRRSGQGRIINIGSLFADHPAPDGAAYSMSKAALAALSRCIAVEEGRHGITANTVAPGYMLTEMHEEEAAMQAQRQGVPIEEYMAQLRSTVPLQRHGTGCDVAGAVLWLLSDGAAYVSGQTIPVNGGLVLS
ncbi:SDR family oxidoreductase [Arthrobacter sp. I2-34]|uniref:SDR family oxidoreductase n=1 Tax=Arthrobacter hankyongi TaxID=2904801 RepID=A0ABS9LDR7_9MICC|nr:SDR family oxidoreductase [Arthrobacter hankyongi]MCG2624820.1 SDR family oxidoreductase [Arthrobacter hankyongi]